MRRIVAVAVASLLGSCSQFVQYTDEIVDSDTGRTPFTTVPANIGGFAGFTIGLPVDLVALPVTYAVYRVQREQNPLKVDAISTMLFPSFVMWRTGTLLGVPMDMVEYITYRVWQPPHTPSRDEQAEIEYEFDEQTLPSYPVTPLYPAEEVPRPPRPAAASMPVRPVYIAPGGALRFPDPRRTDAEGLVAVGGDLSPERLLLAYSRGIFPWYDASVPPLWWSPDPRCVLPCESLHVSRRLERRLRGGGFRLTWNRAFGAVIRACARGRADGTWILPEMIEAYSQLHRLGHAHSLEVWQEDVLAGGLYGVQRGGLFAAESMFHVRTDASKVALVACVRSLSRAGIELFDVQFPTSHLESMGAVCWPRERYLAALAAAVDKRVDLSQLEPSWTA